jgi:CheY-like chemotaxis protein
MPTILCIDDDPRILELHGAVLGGRGYTVLTALDGLTGLTLSRNHSIDAIVLDSTMVSMDGNAVAQILMKEQPKLPAVWRR